MYSVQTTPGFIIDSRPFGEAGKLLSIFTRDLGLILATAQGIRLEKSKLRYHSQEYSKALFSLIKGKEFWRLTNAQESDRSKGYELLARISVILKRFLHGEEPHPELFDIILSSMTYHEIHSDLIPEDSQTLESITVLRILHALGYIGTDTEMQSYVEQALSPVVLVNAREARTRINQHINKALRESHL